MTSKIYFRHDSFRKGQKEMIRDIYEAITLGKNILIHAPTGTGKTDSALSATITYGKEKGKKVLFLTPKISQHKIALEVVEGINEKYNLGIRAVDFVGKKNMCIDPVISKTDSNFYELCLMACKKRQCPFFENIRPSNKVQRETLAYTLEKRLKDKEVLTHLEIKKIAEEMKDASGAPKPVCAYELAKLFAKGCDVVIADYYHVFSEKIRESTLGEIGVALEDGIVIVDEAHNLEERLLKLASKSLNTNTIRKAIKECKDIKENKLKDILEKQLEHIESLAEKKLEKGKEEKIEKDELLIKEIQEDPLPIIEELDASGLEYIEKLKESNSALISVGLFIENWIIEKQAHVRFIRKDKNSISVKYNALDVSSLTKTVFENCNSAILMSATLTPLTMYKDILALPSHTITKEYQSPFDGKKRLNLLITDTSTKFTQRNTGEYKRIAKHIEDCVNAIPGNCVVFFPSFEVLNDILQLLGAINKPKIVQEENMTSLEFEELITEFKRYSRKFGCVLFAVMGGKASEGIDLPGGYLIGAVIVGIPFAKMETEVVSKIDYYEKKFRNGWDYAYIQPAMQKVIQSAGRVIRTETDKGVVVFIDSRFNWERYRKCFPRDLRFVTSKDARLEINSFFRG